MKYNAVALPWSYSQSGAQWRDADKRKLPKKLWQPKHPEQTHIYKYRQHINKKFHINLKNSQELHTWTVQRPHDFWIDLYEYTEIIPPLPKSIQYAYDPKAKFRDIPTWFEGHKLNFAENLLVPNTKRNPNGIALTGLREGKLDDGEDITWAELTELVRITRNALMHHGIRQGDVIAALMSNSIWIVVLFLATASLGGIFTSIAPDMGISGCVTRLAQVTPKLLFSDTDYAARGVRQSLEVKVKDLYHQLKQQNVSFTTIWVSTLNAAHTQHLHPSTNIANCTHLEAFLAPTKTSSTPLDFLRLPNPAPLVIVYSSGTTGAPKCIVSPHLSILNYRKIAHLHNNLDHNSIVFQFSSTSWILWNVMLGHMTVGARLITFDGNPLHPDAGTPLEICERYGATYWGTSPRYLLELEQQTLSGALTRRYDLTKMKLVTTTGAPLLPSQMEFFYSPLFPCRDSTENIQLSSVAGGTDIASSWCASDPAGPVYINEMQMWALGHDCAILSQDPSVKGSGKTKRLEWKEVEGSEPGELICRKTLPSAPVFFWGDDRENSKYMDAYFNRFATVTDEAGEKEFLDVWAQHDLITRNPQTGGIQILGRSDTTLNPSGIRFGSSELYHIIEAPPFNSLISDSLCVGRRRKGDSDEVVFLFLIPAKGVKIDVGLIDRIKAAIRSNLSARHVPKFMFEVSEIPYTINGKKVEGVVKKIISGIDVTPSSTIVNPACLEEYRQYRNVERQQSKL